MFEHENTILDTAGEMLTKRSFFVGFTKPTVSKNNNKFYIIGPNEREQPAAFVETCEVQSDGLEVKCQAAKDLIRIPSQASMFTTHTEFDQCI